MVDSGLKVGEWNELIGEDIQYKITKAGEGPIAELNQLVRCKYIGRLQATGEIFEKADDTGFRIGDSDSTPGLELGLRHMRNKEKGLVRCKAKYGFGPIGRKNIGPGADVVIPPDADLEYEIEVTGIYPAFHPKDAPTAARVAEGSLKKQHGNHFFHHEDYNRAIRCYQAAIKALDADTVGEEDEEPAVYKDMVTLFCDISNNLAAALMKLERWKDAKEVCVKVIEIDKDNVKALYRGGIAALQQDNYVEAELALKEAAKLAPKDTKIRQSLVDLKDRRATYVEKEKKMYQKMSGFLIKPSATGLQEGEEGKEALEGVVGDDEEEEDYEGPSDDEEQEEEVDRKGQQQQRQHDKVGEVEEEEEDDVEEEEEEYDVEDEEQMVAEGKGEEGLIEEEQEKPWLRWYIRNYNHIMTATFMILPVIYLWPDLVKGWRLRLGYDVLEEGGAGEPPEL